LKATVAQQKAWSISSNMNIEVLFLKVGSKAEQETLTGEWWKSLNIVLSASNNSTARKTLYERAKEHRKIMTHLMTNNLKGTTQEFLPGKETGIDLDAYWSSVFNFSKETYSKFPYLPMHSLVWAKESFDQISYGFI
jgi:hypothetical protein